MSYPYITLREKPEIMQTAAEWFSGKWRVPTEAYLACIREYLLTDHTGFYERYGWEFLCMAQGDGDSKPSRMYIHR